MSTTLPTFKYHPDPFATGVLKRGRAACACCGQKRGYVYTGPIYAIDEVAPVCPWCVADGGVERRFAARFNDDHQLRAAGLSEQIVREVACRTPGFFALQQVQWLACCNDACEYRGIIPLAEFRRLDAEDWAPVAERSYWPLRMLQDFLNCDEPDIGVEFHRFVCRHCSKAHFDMSYIS
jgi:uncharacterized protein CbrC (UPF0167 family)